MEKAKLINSGLGCKLLRLFEYGSNLEFHNDLVEAFPKIEDTGGYELLRTEEGNPRELSVIPPPRDGYTASYLKSIVQHTKVYVRPLQQDLVIDNQSISTDEDSDDIAVRLKYLSQCILIYALCNMTLILSGFPSNRRM